ncbi:MAG: ChrR family anti-sigma-E factor [Pseudomonadota bacterium]
MSMVVHNVDESLLLDYASGALNEPMSLAMATHLSLSKKSASDYDTLNAMGGAMLEELAPLGAEDDGDFGLAGVLGRLDDEPIRGRPVSFNQVTSDIIPAPLREYLPGDLSELKWRSAAPGVEEYDIRTGSNSGKTALLRIEPGRAMPKHTHSGREITVVLDGAYVDGCETYRRGDLQEADETENHQPVADGEAGCLCLIVLDASVKLTGRVGRFLNPFIRF